MNMSKKNAMHSLTLIAMAVTLSACGGGGGGSSTGNGSSNNASGNGQTQVPSGPPALPAPDTSIPTTTLARTDGNGCTLNQTKGGYADKSFTIDGVYWLQVVGQDAINTPAQASDATVLASGKDTVVRVDVTGPYAYNMPAQASMTLSTPTGCKSYTLSTQGSTVPVNADKSTLTKSFTATIPAADITGSSSTMAFQVATDTGYASTQTSADRQFKTGMVPVRASVTENIHMVPVSFQGQTGYFPSTASLSTLVTRTEPQASASISVDAAMTLTALDPTKATVSNGVYYYDYNTMASALGEIEQYCHILNNNGNFPNFQSATKCAGVFPDNVVFGTPATGPQYVGLGLTGGLSIFMYSFNATSNGGTAGSFQLPYPAQVFVHEFGHVMTLLHAPCGNPSQVDSRLYSDGSLGALAMGYDALNGFYFNAPNSTAQHYDLMGYCGTGGWTSDRAYRIVLDYKVNGTASSGSSASADIANGSAARTSSDQAQPQRGIVLFRKPNGGWTAMLSPMPAMATGSKALLDGSKINSLLAGLPVTTLTSDAGESAMGPYYIPATPAVMSLLRSGIAGITFKQ